MPYSSASSLSVIAAVNPVSSTSPLVTPTVTETVSLTLKSSVKDIPSPPTLTVGFKRLTGPSLITFGRFGFDSSSSYPPPSNPPTGPVVMSGMVGALLLENSVLAVCLDGNRSKLVTLKRSNWNPSLPP